MGERPGIVGPPPAIQWTEHETALWWTCAALRSLVQDGDMPAAVPVTFAMQQAADEYVYQWGEYTRSWFGAVGDGTYRTSTTIVGGSGPLGILLGVGTLGGSIAGNASRKARARQDATAMWRPCDAGRLFVSTYGFYLHDGQNLMPFGNGCVAVADLIAPGTLEFTANMADGSQQTYRLVTYWAELLFVTWAIVRAPHHPRLANLGWLPREFVERVRYSGAWDSSPLPALAAGP
jgi:hypothetical protein